MVELWLTNYMEATMERFIINIYGRYVAVCKLLLQPLQMQLQIHAVGISSAPTTPL